MRVDADRTLTVPDFLGNFFSNTWGNMAVNAQAGLLFLDFEKGDVLPLAVTADILWEDAEVAHFAGARRPAPVAAQRARDATNRGFAAPALGSGGAAVAQPACLR